MTERISAFRTTSTRVSTRATAVVGAVTLVFTLSSCFQIGTNGGAKTSTLPEGIPEAIPVEAGDVVDLSSAPGNIQLLVLELNDETQDEIVQEFIESGFTVIGSSGEGVNQVYSLANTEHSLRLSFDEVDGKSTAELAIALTDNNGH